MSTRHSVSRLGIVAVGALVAVAGGWSMEATAQDRPYMPVTDVMLQDPDPADWLNWRRTLDGWGYSPLDQIDTGNVHRLQLVWSARLEPGANQTTPLVHDGVMYIANPNNILQSLDAVTGDEIWTYDWVLVGDPDPTLSSRSRSIAIYGDKVYLGSSDARLVAVDARTGELAWSQAVADPALGYRYTSGPIVADGRIVAGMSGCERFKEDVCFISAHDPETGEELWRTSTIARPGEPGGDTWGDLPLRYRAGADSWIPGSYDPVTSLAYFSTSQAKPWARLTRGTDGDALYTNSVLALDPQTGRIEWYHQFVPGETHDLDDVFESVLIDRDGGRSLFKMGKMGILWELDRTTGDFIAAHDLGYQTLIDVDPITGEVAYREGTIPRSGIALEFCPDFRGIRNWPASAYHPATGALYIPIHPTCVSGTFTEIDPELHTPYYLNTGWTSHGTTAHPDSPDHRGHLIAMDVDSGEILWRHSTATVPSGAALTTGGALVVGSDGDRNLFFHDARSGDVLYRTRLPASVQGYPITYAVDGRQYIAVPVGGNRSNAIYVFALPVER